MRLSLANPSFRGLREELRRERGERTERAAVLDGERRRCASVESRVLAEEGFWWME